MRWLELGQDPAVDYDEHQAMKERLRKPGSFTERREMRDRIEASADSDVQLLKGLEIPIGGPEPKRL